jgi:solute carrier family 25 S-adenosylmethionine transporter 26
MDSFLSGAFAGFAVDVSLFPIDTVKTRLQSKDGFWKAGGFTGIYRGLGVVTMGSIPSAGLFFASYDTVKRAFKCSPQDGEAQGKLAAIPLAARQQFAACIGEATACLVRVPVETLKQQLQAGQHRTLREAIKANSRVGGLKGFYGGYGITMCREVPFAAIQFPLYEALKRKTDSNSAIVRGACGSLAGSVAAFLTTPFDVAKTRIMLRQVRKDQEGALAMISVLRSISQEEGRAGLFRGVGPRVFWISLGGGIFLGSYEFAQSKLRPAPPPVARAEPVASQW